MKGIEPSYQLWKSCVLPLNYTREFLLYKTIEVCGSMRYDICMSQGMHHYHDHKKPVTLLDHIMYGIALIGPLFTVPQFLDVWVKQDVSGLSLFTWSAYALFSFLWLLYWIEQHKTVILIGHVIILFLNIGIVLGIFLFS